MALCRFFASYGVASHEHRHPKTIATIWAANHPVGADAAKCLATCVASRFVDSFDLEAVLNKLTGVPDSTKSASDIRKA